ncbi:hypothetical protein [uncultured Roseobacter sp.]|uniref:hypothetical protein n=1 Tax=uncultured Roseobacter sp. TaxID=114847 RepID=UPI00261F3D22|nr:hypothetical protein [uncultured Roseobacter sp.]
MRYDRRAICACRYCTYTGFFFEIAMQTPGSKSAKSMFAWRLFHPTSETAEYFPVLSHAAGTVVDAKTSTAPDLLCLSAMDPVTPESIADRWTDGRVQKFICLECHKSSPRGQKLLDKADAWTPVHGALRCPATWLQRMPQTSKPPDKHRRSSIQSDLTASRRIITLRHSAACAAAAFAARGSSSQPSFPEGRRF